MTGKKVILILVGLILALVFSIAIPTCSYNNSFVEKEQVVEQTWAQVQNVYQRRADLIPNLVNTVKGYAEHEQQTLSNVTEARAGLSKAYNEANGISPESATASQESMQQYQDAQNNLKGALDLYINVVKEAYPDLKANQNFINLQTQLEGTENRIATERMRYTEAVKEYNTAVKKFPGNIFASFLGFDEKPQFQADKEAQKAPEVQF